MEIEKNKHKKLGIFFIFTAIFLWCLVLVIPFLWFDTVTTSVLVWVLLLCGEGMFWLWTFFAGKEILKKWFKKNK